MPTGTDAKPLPELLTCLCSLVCMAGGAVVLGSWFLNLSWFQSMNPEWVVMKANAALGFIVGGVALWFLRKEAMPLRSRLIGKSCAAFVVLIGLLTLVQHTFQLDFGIDQLLIQDVISHDEITPGRMSPITAVCLVFLGLALLGLDWKSRHGYRFDQVPPLIAALSGLFAATGHLYGVKTFYFDFARFFPVAANTALLFMALSLGILCARSGRGPLAILTGAGAGSFMARRLLPLALCSPVVLGWLLLWSRRGGYITNEMELALFTTLLIVLFALLIWHTARSLNRAEASRNTASKLSDEELRKAEVLQRAIFNSANFSCIGTDESGLIQSFNVGAERMLGYTAQEVMHKITPADLSDAQEVGARAAALSLEFDSAIAAGFGALVFKAARGMEDICELSYRRKDGVRVPAIIAVTALHDEAARIIGYLMIGIDNTSRKDVEAAQELLAEGLREQQFYTRSLIESSLDALMMTNPFGVISDVNLQMMTLTGRTRDELIGAPCRNFFTDPVRADVAIARVLTENKVSNFELTVRSRTGEETVVSYNAATFHDRESKLQGVIAAARDVTERKRFEHTLQEKNIELEHASRMKSEFLATMSHELRTPLNAIIGFSEALRDGLMGPLSESQHEYIGDIFTSGQHLLSLINDILDLSKVEAGMMALELEAVDIESLLSSSLSIVREKAATQQVSLVLELGGDLGVPQLDMRKTKQIVYNLLSNAVKFSARGGRVTLGARRVSRSAVGTLPGAWPVHSFAQKDNGYAEFRDFLEISVSDSGIGISRDNMAKLFQAFKQIDSSLARKFEGTGLGLAMVKQLAELHGGTVAVASAEGEGARFAVWLPLRTAAQCANTGSANSDIAPAIAAGGKERIALVVEDDDLSADLIRLLLEAEGMTVVRAASAETGLLLAPLHQLSLITLDITLPDMDGWEFLRRIRENEVLAQVPVVIISSMADVNMALSGGAAAVLEKPISRIQLKTSLASLGLHPNEENTYTVLVVDDDPNAVEVIAGLLPSPAYAVVRAYGGSEAIALAQRVQPDLILLDLMMSQVSGFDVVSALHGNAETAHIPVLVVTAKQITQQDRDVLNADPDKPINIVEKAAFNRAAFILEVRRALLPH